MTDQAADTPQRVCTWCKTMAPERFSDAEVIRTPLPWVHHVHELCQICGDSYETRLRILRPDIVEAQESQRAEAVRRDREDIQRIIGDRILANRARPANGGTMRTTEQQATATRAKELRRKRNDANRKRRQAMDQAQAHLGVAQQQGCR